MVYPDAGLWWREKTMSANGCFSITPFISSSHCFTLSVVSTRLHSALAFSYT